MASDDLFQPFAPQLYNPEVLLSGEFFKRMFPLALRSMFMTKKHISFGDDGVERIFYFDELCIQLCAELISRVGTLIYALFQHPYNLFFNIMFDDQLDLLLQFVALIQSLEIIE